MASNKNRRKVRKIPRPKRWPYKWELKRRVPHGSVGCKELHDYLKVQISGARVLREFDSNSTDSSNCIVKFVMTSPSFGTSSAAELRRNIVIRFPDIDVTEYTRERKQKKSGSRHRPK